MAHFRLEILRGTVGWRFNSVLPELTGK